MKVEIIKCLQDNYSYLIINEINNNVCVIDPSEASTIIDFVEKKKLKLSFILNTHHHHDHVGGNLVLKKKYNSKVIGYFEDKQRIPGIDIFLKDKEVWKEGDFSAKIFHVPGHTSGHICFYFEKEKLLFTGDTLFSLGCGRIFEGTFEQMFSSLKLIKSFPKNTKIFCGHEYTLNNYKFCAKYDKRNKFLKEKLQLIEFKLNKNLPTIPTTLEEELNTNIFLRYDNEDLKSDLGLKDASDLETFKKLRELKDTF